jgi:hypothetical protein
MPEQSLGTLADDVYLSLGFQQFCKTLAFDFQTAAEVSRPNHVIYPQLFKYPNSIINTACMTGHAQAAFNHSNALKPNKNVRSVDKSFKRLERWGKGGWFRLGLALRNVG